MVVIPIDTEVDEAQNVAEEYGDQRQQSLDALAVGRLQLQYHDGDDDGDHAIAERFKPILSHAERARLSRPQWQLRQIRPTPVVIVNFQPTVLS